MRRYILAGLFLLLASSTAHAAEVSLAWGESPGAEKYLVWWGGGADTFPHFMEVPGDTLTATIQGLACLDTWFAVSAVNEHGSSDLTTTNRDGEVVHGFPTIEGVSCRVPIAPPFIEIVPVGGG